METKLNIAEILKNKPKGTKLHSSVYGDVKLELITEEDSKYSVITMVNAVCGIEYISFTENGLYYEGYPGAELTLFPSSKMRDWSKFVWKKGDVLVSMEGSKILFDKWVNEDYTKFLGKIKVLGNSHCYDTAYYTLASKEEALEFIKSVEEINNGKLNHETLEIEKQPEFKDGDIVFIESHMLGINTSSMIAIFRKEKEIDKYRFSPALCESKEHDTYLREDSVVLSPSDIKIFRPSTDSEKQQLFDALTKEGKAWDAEKKQIVDLKPKVELKSFDKVLVRDSKSDKWRVNLYGYKGNDRLYYCVYACWHYCIPYEGNEYLLGTTENVKE